MTALVVSGEVKRWPSPLPPRHAAAVPYPAGTTWWQVTLRRTEPGELRDRKRQMTVTIPTGGTPPEPLQALDMAIKAARNYDNAAGLREWQEMEGIPLTVNAITFYDEVGKYSRRLRKFLGAHYDRVVLLRGAAASEG